MKKGQRSLESTDYSDQSFRQYSISFSERFIAIELLRRIVLVFVLGLMLLLTASFPLRAQVDPAATDLTVTLYGNLKAEAENFLMYGQQQAYLVGLHADGIGEYSDSKYISGDNPAVVGYDLVRVGQWDPVDTDTGFHKQVVAHFLRGGVNTFSWHAPNPSPNHTGDGKYSDTSGNPVQGILTPGSQTRANWNAMLDDVSSFFKNLEVEGVAIPIIWRPLHEQLHTTFWWGSAHCTKQEYIDLWRYTFNYMVNTEGVHNLLWAQSPNEPPTEGAYLYRYPGDSYVDVLGFDYYGDADSAGYDAKVLNTMQIVAGLAESRGKLAAFTEGGPDSRGFEFTSRTDYFTSVWLDNVMNDPIARKISYVLAWNSPKLSAFEEGPNAHLYDDFIEFYSSSHTKFESDLPDLYDDGLGAAFYEAEEATLTGVLVGTNRSGYSGTGHTRRESFGESGDKIEFAVTVSSADDYWLTFRYNSAADKPNPIDVNGVEVGTATFVNSNNEWGFHVFGPVSMNLGNNTVAIRKSWGWIDVDYLAVMSYGFYELLEAEDASLTGVNLGTDRPGYSGTGHTKRNSFDGTGDAIEFTVNNVPSTGNYKLAIRYNSGGDKPNKIEVNGVLQGEPTFLDSNNNWHTFEFGDVPLNSGTNTVTIIKSWGWIDVDYIEIYGF